MSHISKIEMEIKSLAALKKACQRMGLEFRENQKQFAWYGQGVPRACDHTIHVPDAIYEVGVVKSKDRAGSFDLQWDAYSPGGLTTKLGQGAGLLKQAYAIEQAKIAAHSKGHIATEQKQTNGSVKLVITVN